MSMVNSVTSPGVNIFSCAKDSRKRARMIPSVRLRAKPHVIHINQLRGEVGITRRGRRVQHQPHRAGDLEVFGERLGRIDQDVRARLSFALIPRAALQRARITT